MGSAWNHGKGQWLPLLMLLLAYSVSGVNCETADCREQEFMDHAGKCIPCQQCGPGEELSKECGFGDQEDAQCMPCRPNRFKEDWGFQKCKPCQDCGLINRSQKANCSSTSNAACGDCLPGFYRKTKLGGFQDMECVPCGDPPPPYEPHCHTKVNLVKIPATASSPRDTALAAVICSALSTVLLALLILCIIYCKRQFMEKKPPSWSSRSQDFKGSEMSCFDRHRINPCAPRTCHHCQREAAPVQACGPVHMIPSLFCDEACHLEHSRSCCSFHSESTLHDRRNADSLGEMMPPPCMGSVSRFSSREIAEVWPLMQTPSDRDATSYCEAGSEHTEDHLNHFSEKEDAATNNTESDVRDGAELVRDLCSKETALELEDQPEDGGCHDTPPPTIEAIENQSPQASEENTSTNDHSDTKDS